MLGDELLGERNEVLGFAAIEADGLDLVLERGRAEGGKLLGHRGDREQIGRRAVDRGVGRLRRQDHGHEQRKRVAIAKLGLRVWVELGEAAENLRDRLGAEPRSRRALGLRPRLAGFLSFRHGPCLPLARGIALSLL
jgi:hypothetical protein